MNKKENRLSIESYHISNLFEQSIYLDNTTRNYTTMLLSNETSDLLSSSRFRRLKGVSLRTISFDEYPLLKKHYRTILRYEKIRRGYR